MRETGDGRRETEDGRREMRNSQLVIGNFVIGNYQRPITNYQLPITNCYWLTATPDKKCSAPACRDTASRRPPPATWPGVHRTRQPAACPAPVRGSRSTRR